MHTLSVLATGYSIVQALVLLVAYTRGFPALPKSRVSLLAAALMLGGLVIVQLFHLQFLLDVTAPFEHFLYRLALFTLPPAFFTFCLCTLFPQRALATWYLLHFVPMLLALLQQRVAIIAIAFVLGSSYCLWLCLLAWRLRALRKTFSWEFAFLTLFLLLALVVMVLAVSMARLDQRYFYFFYLHGIALALVLISLVLLVRPQLIEELHEAIALAYAQSTLGQVDVAAKLGQLNELMQGKRLYGQEDLSLNALAQHLGMSGHQMSELINTQFGMNYPRYLRGLRVDAAKKILLEQPRASVLAIGMEVGFKSQSTFYAAFKEVTGASPGYFREHPPRLSCTAGSKPSENIVPQST